MSNGHLSSPISRDAPAGSSTARFDVIAIASSAGGLGALTRVLSPIEAGFPASILVVQHLDPRHGSLMAEILSRRTRLTVVQAEADASIEPGTVYIAPPDKHLLANPDRTMSLTQSELVHFVRPSADLLFESVAAAFRERAIAVVLTGGACAPTTSSERASSPSTSGFPWSSSNSRSAPSPRERPSSTRRRSTR